MSWPIELRAMSFAITIGVTLLESVIGSAAIALTLWYFDVASPRTLRLHPRCGACSFPRNGPGLRSSSFRLPLDDFARLFAPGGLIDGYFNTQLRPYVDTSGKVWQLQPADGIVPP